MSEDANGSIRQLLAGLVAAPIAGFAHAGAGDVSKGPSASAVATDRIPIEVPQLPEAQQP